MNDAKRITAVNADKKMVDVTRTTKTSKGGKQYACNWVLDYQNVTEEQLLSLATRGIVIDLQRQFRDAKPDERDELAIRTVDVSEFLAATRTRKVVDPREQALKFLRAISEDDRNQLMEDLGVSI